MTLNYLGLIFKLNVFVVNIENRVRISSTKYNILTYLAHKLITIFLRYFASWLEVKGNTDARFICAKGNSPVK